jgi:hypothetical protein
VTAAEPLAVLTTDLMALLKYKLKAMWDDSWRNKENNKLREI